MKVFISHASVDQQIANAVSTLIQNTFQETVAPVHSSASVYKGGIEAGADWLNWINEQVRESFLAVVILTPNSQKRPWIMWEAGAVSGAALATDKSILVVPLIFGIPEKEIPSPLRSRQAKLGAEERDIIDFLETIRVRGSLNYKVPISESTAISYYLREIHQNGIPGMYDVFISCPITSISNDKYKVLRESLILLKHEMNNYNLSVYCAALRVPEVEKADSEDISAEEDLAALKASRNFVLIYPEPVMSSCIMEVGYALIAGIPSVYFVTDEKKLPYMLRGAIEVFPNARKVRYTELNEIVSFFKKYPKRIVGYLNS